MKQRYLLDTNIISELAKPTPDERVIQWLSPLAEPTTSAVVCYEISRGIERLSRGKRRSFLEAWFSELLRVVLTLAVDEKTALLAARIEGAASRAGRTLEVRDLLILATAQANDCALATRNVDDFQGLGIVIYDPFTGVRTM